MNKLMLTLALTLILSACQQQGAPMAAAPAPAAKPAPLDQPAQPPAPKTADQLAAEKYDSVLAGDWRDAKNKARDGYRHPKEMLQFFGLKPDMTVIEITPAGGWFTEVLAPFLRDGGKYIGAVYDEKAEGASKSTESSNLKLEEKLKARQDAYGPATLTRFTTKVPTFGADNSADMVLTFRNVHNWSEGGTAPQMFQAFFKVLKPGGILGVEDHRAAAGAAADASMKLGYLPEDYVIKLATDAGFKLVGKSEINANPKDTKDYAKGVWTLPPVLTLGEVDKDKYLAIGESDRMTLKFVKPQGDTIFHSPDPTEKK
ncbi:methyltransferase [Pseudolysobacter antarcticus]|uniref:Methyltransferase n=1 Tax=Pseudolysobacter antarcticus TaxID=2511995 RepID=A0A411HP95_9GAMM|nr:class I SAM-dependent methyltransferase [Pseudolysobacter antarcticus]QBB72305.1 methyltransferase [Pseudolysobacter antarcticus]